MYKFFDKKNVEVFSSEKLSEVEEKAKEYKKKNNLQSIEICTNKGKFFKWI
jgi:hypothetical protein